MDAAKYLKTFLLLFGLSMFHSHVTLLSKYNIQQISMFANSEFFLLEILSPFKSSLTTQISYYLFPPYRFGSSHKISKYLLRRSHLFYSLTLQHYVNIAIVSANSHYVSLLWSNYLGIIWSIVPALFPHLQYSPLYIVALPLISLVRLDHFHI